MRLDVAGCSDVGRVRTVNEDRYAIREDLPGGVTLCVLADGMGGHAAGEVAATLAVEQVVESVAQGTDLPAAIQRANAAIFRRSGDDPSGRGMGTTITCALIDGERARYAHAGDSRIYLVRDGAARQLTEDHSWVAEQVRAGRLSAEQARRSSRRNLVTRALGLLPEVEVDAGACPLRAGDALLLCSDGVHGLVADEELAAACAQPAEQAGARLIELANSRGGGDNATVVIARVLEGGPVPERTAITRPLPDPLPAEAAEAPAGGGTGVGLAEPAEAGPAGTVTLVEPAPNGTARGEPVTRAVAQPVLPRRRLAAPSRPPAWLLVVALAVLVALVALAALAFSGLL